MIRAIFVFELIFLLSYSTIAQRGTMGRIRQHKMNRHGLKEVVLKFDDLEQGHAWVSHQGKPKLLLLHGITGNAEVQFSKNALRLSKHFDVIALDLKFHGESKNASHGYDIMDQVHWVADCLKLLSELYSDEDYNNVHAVGNSYGGIVAGLFAHQYPNLVKELTLIDAPIRFFTKAMADSVAQSVDVPDFFSLLSPEDVKTFRKRTSLSIHRKLWVPPFIAKKIILRDLKPLRAQHEKLINTLIQNEQKWNDYSIEWKCPVNIFWGQSDDLIPLVVGNRQSVYFKNAKFKVLPKVGHVWNIERPRQFEKWLINHQKILRTTITPSF